ncbi:MAG: hypothetical protein AMXMBFR12_02650 [Candidatus Babeliales bacterium]
MTKNLLFSLLAIFFCSPNTINGMWVNKNDNRNIIEKHPFACLLAGTAAAATSYAIYNPAHARAIAERAIHTSGVANSIIIGGSIGTAAGLLSNYMEHRKMVFSTLLPFIVGITMYETTKNYMGTNNIPFHEAIGNSVAISTWCKPDWYTK